jgi:oligosaccharide repeat unit polymerase
LPITDYDVLVATLLISLFLLLTLIIYWIVSHWLEYVHSKHKDSGRPLSETRLTVEKLFSICLILTLLGIVPFILYGDGLAEILQGILGSRTIQKEWIHVAFESNPIYVLGRASLVSAGALALGIFLLAETKAIKMLVAILFVLSFAITYFDSGTRTWTLMIIIPPIMTWLMIQIKNHAFTKKTFFLVSAIIIVVFQLAQIQLESRVTGFFHNKGSAVIGTMTGDDNDFFLETAISVSTFPFYFEHVGQSNLLLFITNPIPRSIWPGKPYPEVIRQYSYARDGWDIYFESGISRLPSIVGQYYISWGVLGVFLISIVYGFMLAWIDFQWRQEQRTWFTYFWLSVFTVWIFVSFRGMFPGFHYPVIILGILVVVERWISNSQTTFPYLLASKHKSSIYHFRRAGL